MRISSDLRGEVWSSPDSRCSTAFLRQESTKYFLGFTEEPLFGKNYITERQFVSGGFVRES